MRTATWDASDPEMRWDNPNLRWGYLLEPGDPGYVPPATRRLLHSAFCIAGAATAQT